MMMMRVFTYSFNKQETLTVIFSGHDRKEEMCQEENIMFQEHFLGCAGFPD